MLVVISPPPGLNHRNEAVGSPLATHWRVKSLLSHEPTVLLLSPVTISGLSERKRNQPQSSLVGSTFYHLSLLLENIRVSRKIYVINYILIAHLYEDNIL